MTQLNKDIFLEDEKVILRAINEKDVEGNYKYWLNDPEIVQFNSHGRFPMTQERLLDFVKSVTASNTTIVLAVVEKEQNLHIGNISLQAINWIDRNAEIAFLLGEKKFQGKGIMYNAACLIIAHAFKTLNLHRIHCGTSSANIGMQKLAEKMGMQKEGIRKDAIFKNGSYFDIIEYGMINNFDRTVAG